MAAKKPRSTKDFTTLDEVLDQDGTREAFQAVAIKEVLAWQNSIPSNGNVTLVTLQRAAELPISKTKFAMRAKTHEFEAVMIRFAVDENEIGTDMAVAMIAPLTR